MQFVDKEIKIKGKGASLSGNSHTVTVSIAQFDNLPELSQAVGGDDGIVALANAFYSNRAPSSFRSSVTNFMKDKKDWNEVVKFADERAGSVKDYSFTADRGPSRKAQHDILDSLDKSAVESMSLEEIKAHMLKLVGG